MPDQKKSAGPLATKSAALNGRCLLSWEEAAAYLGPSVNVRWLKRQVYDTKTLPARRISGKTFIEQAALDEFVDSAPTTSNRKRRTQSRKAVAQKAKR